MKKTLKGFTLIELLIVIAIIGVLSVAFLPSLLGAPAKGRDASRMSQVQKIGNFLATQALANKTLPVTACIDPAVAAPTAAPASTDSIGAWIKYYIADFGGVSPKDPQTTNVSTGAPCTSVGQYGYVKFTHSPRKYTAAAYAALENKDSANIACKDIKVDADPVIVAGSAITVDATTAACYITLIQ